MTIYHYDLIDVFFHPLRCDQQGYFARVHCLGLHLKFRFLEQGNTQAKFLHLFVSVRHLGQHVLYNLEPFFMRFVINFF